ncbi:hypothetical protein F9817_21700 [Vibrio sp. CAIM 722]|uniref:Uncharacterized protein n=1 Tax=Vibrio eleionomae TaxID=2653505 RepID=A0A7X4LPI9_9VIBR|nr:hypothetical protein [Vibrio eleionomae]MZI95803.1 hypothetical protein [Vibrio eleionomae]
MKSVDYKSKVSYFYNQRFINNDKLRLESAFVPDSIVQAYDIQKEIINSIKEPVLAWKLGGTNKKTQEMFGCSKCYIGPVYFLSIGDNLSVDGKYARAELELSFRISANINELNVKDANTNPLSFFDMVFPSAEFPLSNIENMTESGMRALIADLCGTGFLALGKGIEISHLESFCDKEINASIMDEDNCLAVGNLSNLLGGYRKVLSDFLLSCLEYDLPLASGQYCSTGGLSPCVYLSVDKILAVKFDFFDDFLLKIKS